ncbi:MAG TPA: glycosyltransferase family 2 protein [Candidatus Woesebacteria bacterium]|nr:glycosyltransferase family 2 protein [Candidatus Woesebacteria bacterium]
MKFSIIIPNYNGAALLEDCIKSFGLSNELIIIDNGSKDNSLKKINELKHSLKIKNCKLIINQTNYGFAAAVNQGIKAAKYNYVVIANNDLVIDKNWFKYISQAIKKYPKVACFCGIVLNKSGTKYESAGLKFFYSGKCQNLKNGEKFIRADTPVSPYYVWGSSAALVVYQKSVLEKIGFFDEDFFAYEEDVDLALRLDKFGYKTLLVPQAISYHLGGGTSSKMGNLRQINDFSNWIFIIIKNFSFKEIFLNFPQIIYQRLINFIVIPHKSIKIFRRLKLIPKMLKKRQELQNLLKSSHDHWY